MKNIDYSLSGSLTLKDTGFLSCASNELIKFLLDNQINTVYKFLESIDNNDFRVGTYNDVMNEARGLAEILKFKYFQIFITSDIFLFSPISRIEFNLPAGKFTMLGIKGNKNHTTIYTVINRLGFNDKERDIILKRYEDELIGRTLIDIFQDILSDNRDININEEDKVFYNKLTFYESYFQNKIDVMVSEKLIDKLDILTKELEELISKKNQLELQIEYIKDNIEKTKEGIRSIGK